MALTINKLKMWKDPGYTKGCLEVPPAGSKRLPAVPDYTLPADETLRPLKESTLTSLKLPLSYTQLFDMSYLYIEASDGNGTVSLFGWIDSISQAATSASNTQINWTVDWWRSYSGQMTFGTGTITHCNDSTYKRPYQTQPRKWVISTYEKLNRTFPAPYTTNPWVVNVVYSETVGGATVIRTYFWRTKTAGNTGESETFGGVTYYAPGLKYVYSGRLDEVLDLDPASIIGIYITPVIPSVISGSQHRLYTDADGNKWFAYYSEGYTSYFQSAGLSATYLSDDNRKAVIIDPTGAIVYTMPWGFSANYATVGVDVGTVGASVKVELRTAGVTESDRGLRAAARGLLASFPAISAPYNSNAYASYCYSGQRDYDHETRNIQRDEQTWGGVIGIVSSAAGASPSGLLSGTVSTPLNWWLSGSVNDKLNEATDKLYSNQASTVIQSAIGSSYTDTFIAAGDWYIVQLEADTVSEAEYTAHIAKNGYSTDISAASCTSFITTGGPLQITNMVVTGNAPPQAKQYIKDMFTNGVIIQENNPSGVAP